MNRAQAELQAFEKRHGVGALNRGDVDDHVLKQWETKKQAYGDAGREGDKQQAATWKRAEQRGGMDEQGKAELARIGRDSDKIQTTRQKSQAGADARTAARDYADQRRDGRRAAYTAGQSAGRAQGRSAQAAESRGRGRYEVHGGPSRGFGGRRGEMRGGVDLVKAIFSRGLGGRGRQRPPQAEPPKAAPPQTPRKDSPKPAPIQYPKGGMNTGATKPLSDRGGDQSANNKTHGRDKFPEVEKSIQEKVGSRTPVERDYIRYKNKDRSKSNLSSDADRRAMLRGESSIRRDESSSDNLASDSDRYNLLTGKGKSYLDQYRAKYQF